MKVYILYETKDADEYGFGTRDDVLGLYAKRINAQKVKEMHTRWAKKHSYDYTYNIVPEKVK